MTSIGMSGNKIAGWAGNVIADDDDPVFEHFHAEQDELTKTRTEGDIIWYHPHVAAHDTVLDGLDAPLYVMYGGSYGVTVFSPNCPTPEELERRIVRAFGDLVTLDDYWEVRNALGVPPRRMEHVDNMEHVDTINIESEENGLWLMVDTDEGSYRFVLGIDESEKLYDACKREIAPWLHERDAARGTGVRVTEDDLEGYDPGDPKRVELGRIIDRGGWA